MPVKGSMREYKGTTKDSKPKYLRRRRKKVLSVREKRAKLFRLLKGLLVLWIAGVLVYIVVMGARAVTASGYFTVTGIEYAGQAHLTYEELNRLSGLDRAGNVFSVNLDRACKGIAVSPWVKEVSVRRFLPDRIRVEIVERKPAVILKGEVSYLADREGVILAGSGDVDTADLPVISGVAVSGGSIEEQGAEKVAAALELFDFISKNSKFTSDDTVEVLAASPDNMALLLNGLEIRLGRGDYATKFKRLSEVEQDIRRKGIEVAYIDLRFADKVVVKPIEQAEPDRPRGRQKGM